GPAQGRPEPPAPGAGRHGPGPELPRRFGHPRDRLGIRPDPSGREARTVKILTRSLVRHAHAIAREVGARVVMFYADVIEEDRALCALIQDVDFRVILVSRRAGFQAPPGWDELCAVVRVPNISMTRAGQIKVATLVAAAESLVHQGDRILWLTGVDGSGT